jgi:hypothetical protein
LSEDVRAWNELNLGVREAGALDAEQQQTILEVANRALESGECDPEHVLRAARRVSRRAHMVENLRAYATRAMFRIKDSVGLAQAKEEPLEYFEFAPELIDVSQVEQIENKILIRELLETVKPLDREIFTRHMRGDTCPEIDADLGLKPRTAEIRFAFCKNALRKAFMDKVDRKNCARGC